MASFTAAMQAICAAGETAAGFLLLKRVHKVEGIARNSYQLHQMLLQH